MLKSWDARKIESWLSSILITDFSRARGGISPENNSGFKYLIILRMESVSWNKLCFISEKLLPSYITTLTYNYWMVSSPGIRYNIWHCIFRALFHFWHETFLKAHWNIQVPRQKFGPWRKCLYRNALAPKICVCVDKWHDVTSWYQSTPAPLSPHF